MNDWGKVAIGLGIGALLLVVWPEITSTTKKNAERQKLAASATPGWDDLLLCSELVSFDGKRFLNLFRNGTATLVDNSGSKKQSTKGQWELANAPGRYRIEFDDRPIQYERVAPEEWNSCMLVVGTSVSANLRLSWFALEPEPSDQ